jgi:hypothetical protein
MNNITGALRQLKRRPGLSLTIIAILALGVGSTTAMFSLVYEVVVDSLPVPETDRLVERATAGPMAGGAAVSLSGGAEHIFSYPMFRDLEQQQTVFAGLAAHRDFQAGVVEGQQTSAGSGVLVSGGYFGVRSLSTSLRHRQRTFTELLPPASAG